MKDFKYGVYLKQNGNLVLLEKGVIYKYFILDGKKITNPLLMALYKKIKEPIPYIVGVSTSVGWGPTKYLNKCEYLGEL